MNRIDHVNSVIRNGYLSVWSVYGVLCFVAPGSVLSSLSIGSVLSFASVGSTTSVLSIGSVNSYLSVASRNCQHSFSFFTDCTRGVHNDSKAVLEMHFAPEKYDLLAQCTVAEKSNYNARNGVPSHCNYVTAACIYQQDGVVVYNASCMIKRKGHSSWRSAMPWRKPSFKLKFDNKIAFAFNWESKKLTLNNMVLGRGDLDGGPNGVSAYQVFKNMGYPYVPKTLAVRARVFREGFEIADELYAGVETVNDKSFMNKHFGKDHLLFEYEGSAQGTTEFKRGGGVYDDDVGKCGGSDCSTPLPLLKTALGPPLTRDMNQSELTTFAAAERATMHFDGACFNPLHKLSNAYLAYSLKTQKFALIPHGLDQTFRACSSFAVSPTLPACAPMQMCFDDAACRASYLKKTVGIDVGSECAAEVVRLLLPNILFTLLVIAVSLCLAALKNKSDHN